MITYWLVVCTLVLIENLENVHKHYQESKMKHFLHFCILSILVIKVSSELTCDRINNLHHDYRHYACSISNVTAFKNIFSSRIMRCRSDAKVWAICMEGDIEQEVRNVLTDNTIVHLGAVTSDSWVSTPVSIPLGLLIFLVSTTVISVGLLVFIFIRTCAKCQRNQSQD